MTRIDPTSTLLAQIRARTAASRRAGSARADERPSAQGGAPSPETETDWPAQLTQALCALDPEDPRRPRRAFRAYLQAVLARECGFRHANDPGLASLVDEVQTAMESEPRLRSAMDEAGRSLLRAVDRD